MDKKTKTKKPAKEEDEEGEIVMGNNDMDMVNFNDNQDMGEEFKVRKEPNMIHLHYQQRTTRKCLTIVQGLPYDLDLKKILRAWKKDYNCNGAIHKDEENTDGVIQLQGDKRKDVAKFLVEEGIASKEEIKIHGA